PSVIAAGLATRYTRLSVEATPERQRLGAALFRLGVREEAGREIRVFGLADELGRRERGLREEVLSERTMASVKGAIANGVGALAFAAGYIGAVVVVARKAASGRATVGDVLLAITLASQVNLLVANV